jgi:hypothetical protein
MSITSAENAVDAASVTAEQLEVFADQLTTPEAFARAAQVYQEHGAMIVRGLMKPYLADLQRDIEAAVKRAIELLPQARKINEGWSTPDGTLWLPAPAGLEKVLGRDKQIMIPPVTYQTSGAFVQSGCDARVLDWSKRSSAPTSRCSWTASAFTKNRSAATRSICIRTAHTLNIVSKARSEF